ncbi:DUF2290 domain-containing protein, partial [Alteromonas sp. KUL150]|uniref:DUF2290 domain-containing protein n=1 Tax=Alteromonas sp. KUL150 TaxID=2480805 RepID=UPI0013300563
MLRADIERAFQDINQLFADFILETNVATTASTISWNGYRSGFFSNRVYGSEYQNLIDSRQFSFLLFDKSFLQLFFEWDRNELRKAKLAYFPVPVKISNAYDDILESAEESGIDILEDLFFGVESWVDKGINVVNTSHIRLDFDASVTTHSKCHLQVGAINELRIDSKRLLNPFVFCDWILQKINLNGY